MEEVLGAAIEDGRFDVMLLVYSFLNQEMGQRILKACREKKIGTTLMKTDPFGGAYVFWMGVVEEYEKEGKKVPEYLLEVRRKFKEKHANAAPFIKKYNLNNKAEIRDAAIRFVLSNQDVNSVVITFMNFEDIEDYLRLSGSRFTVLDKKKLTAYSMVNGNLYCRHACGICESQCPHGVPVNTIMRYNHYFVAQGQQKYAMEKYAKMEGPKAVSCETCRGFCSTHCPYGVPIQSLLNLAHLNLTLA
jgi:predicted aldo/keto reductase-like oxidoreductase